MAAGKKQPLKDIPMEPTHVGGVALSEQQNEVEVELLCKGRLLPTYEWFAVYRTKKGKVFILPEWKFDKNFREIEGDFPPEEAGGENT